MNPKALFLILMVALIIYLGVTQKAVCNAPYIQHGNACCIDSNMDYVCDVDQPEAFATTSSATTTTLDPCIGLSGYNKTECLFKKEKKGYYDGCVEQCDNSSTACRSACDSKERSKEKIACADTCFKEYKLCYSECGTDPSPAQGPVKEADKKEKDALPRNITEVY
jgi:hypothetical protein